MIFGASLFIKPRRLRVITGWVQCFLEAYAQITFVHMFLHKASSAFPLSSVTGVSFRAAFSARYALQAFGLLRSFGYVKQERRRFSDEVMRKS